MGQILPLPSPDTHTNPIARGTLKSHAHKHTQTHMWARAPSRAWPRCRPAGPGCGHRPHHPHGSADTLPAPWGLTKELVRDRFGQKRSDSTPTSGLFRPCPLLSVHQCWLSLNICVWDSKCCLGRGGLGACHHSPPLTLCHNESCEVGVQLILLVDAPLLDAIPALLLGDAQSTGDVVPKVEPLLLSQIVG